LNVEKSVGRSSEACWVMDAELNGMNRGDVGFDPVP
jgi:hypothetical protein